MKSAIAIAAFATLCAAQQPRFEVASVKPGATREIGGSYTYPGGRVAFRGCTLHYLVMLAYDLQEFQIAGAADWMTTERFDIDATVPPDSASSRSNPSLAKSPMNDEQRLMLRSLLAERFGLKIRQDTAEGPAYVLATNGKALKMTDAKDKAAYTWSGSIAGGALSGDGMRGVNETMPDLAHRLSRYVGRPVLDRTGLSGSFDFEVRYATEGQRPDIVSMIVTCLNELGLKLEATSGPVAKLVIERAQRPTDN